MSKITIFFSHLKERLDGRNIQINSEEKHTCLNCGTEYIGNYCNRCGQTDNIDKIKGRSVIRQLFMAFFSIDSNFFYSLFSLYSFPGEYIGGFLKGKRSGRIRPVELLVILCAIYAFLITLFPQQETSIFTFDSPNTINLIKSRLIAKMGSFYQSSSYIVLKNMALFFKDNFIFLQIANLPIYSIATWWAFGSTNKVNHYKFNLAEIIVIRIYISCMLLVVNCLWINMDNNNSIIVDFIINYWTFLELYGKRKINTFLRVMLFYFYSIVIGLSLIILGLTLLIIIAEI